jgi:hypothetical protein
MARFDNRRSFSLLLLARIEEFLRRTIDGWLPCFPLLLTRRCWLARFLLACERSAARAAADVDDLNDDVVRAARNALPAALARARRAPFTEVDMDSFVFALKQEQPHSCAGFSGAKRKIFRSRCSVARRIIARVHSFLLQGTKREVSLRARIRASLVHSYSRNALRSTSFSMPSV